MRKCLLTAISILLAPVLIPILIWAKKSLLGIPIKSSILQLFGKKIVMPSHKPIPPYYVHETTRTNDKWVKIEKQKT